MSNSTDNLDLGAQIKLLMSRMDARFDQLDERTEGLCNRVDGVEATIRDLRKDDRILRVAQEEAIGRSMEAREILDSKFTALEGRIRAMELRPEPKDPLSAAKRRVLYAIAAVLMAAAAAMGGGAIGGALSRDAPAPTASAKE